MSIRSPYAIELGFGVLLLLVFVMTLVVRGDDRRKIGWIAALGVLAILVGSLLVPPASPAPPPPDTLFVLDGLAIFAKRLFLLATFIGVLAGLSSSGPTGRCTHATTIASTRAVPAHRPAFRTTPARPASWNGGIR